MNDYLYIYYEYSQGYIAAAVAQWVRALAPQAEGCMFESQSRQT